MLIILLGILYSMPSNDKKPDPKEDINDIKQILKKSETNRNLELGLTALAVFLSVIAVVNSSKSK